MTTIHAGLPECDPFELASLYPASTGLPVRIWVRPYDPLFPAIWGAWGSTSEDWKEIANWRALNAGVLQEYQDGAIDAVEMTQRLIKVPKN